MLRRSRARPRRAIGERKRERDGVVRRQRKSRSAERVSDSRQRARFTGLLGRAAPAIEPLHELVEQHQAAEVHGDALDAMKRRPR